jgi:hypothetical protein
MASRIRLWNRNHQCNYSCYLVEISVLAVRLDHTMSTLGSALPQKCTETHAPQRRPILDWVRRWLPKLRDTNMVQARVLKAARSLCLSCRWPPRQCMRRRRTTLFLGCAKSVVAAPNMRARVLALIIRCHPFRDRGLLNLRSLRPQPSQRSPRRIRQNRRTRTNRRSVHHRLRLITNSGRVCVARRARYGTG